jgi:hypothetical protein
MPIIVTDASGVTCRWITGVRITGRDGTVLRRASRAVDNYNELSSLQSNKLMAVLGHEP